MDKAFTCSWLCGQVTPSLRLSDPALHWEQPKLSITQRHLFQLQGTLSRQSHCGSFVILRHTLISEMRHLQSGFSPGSCGDTLPSPSRSGLTCSPLPTFSQRFWFLQMVGLTLLFFLQSLDTQKLNHIPGRGCGCGKMQCLFGRLQKQNLRILLIIEII